jgi:hypothetical protein
MKTFTISVAAAGVLACSSVLAQFVGEKTGINSALDISPTTADFVKEAATSDMLEMGIVANPNVQLRKDDHFAMKNIQGFGWRDN